MALIFTVGSDHKGADAEDGGFSVTMFQLISFLFSVLPACRLRKAGKLPKGGESAIRAAVNPNHGDLPDSCRPSHNLFRSGRAGGGASAAFLIYVAGP